ncbi:ABC transporter substrate-binding protein [Streptomyces sp. NPDC049577]|uniref:ABC transporter substrate-binding protein n=1 Tax=Streptomyces sp. NPDC049577 TaxID=3155153 RepID=UPI003436DAC3
MRKRDQWLAAPLGAGLAAALLTGCGSEDGKAAGTGESVVMGISEEVQATDPASGYDPATWLLFNNVFQSLMSFPKGSTTPQPEAAKKCGFKDDASKTYECTLQDGLKFSNGHELTSEDVAFSFRRTLKINDENGPAAALLSSIGDIKTPDKSTVVFHLNRPDATFPQKIASGAGSIVDHQEYPADRLRTDGKAVGSGVYKLESFDKNKAVFKVNGSYKGPAVVQNSGMTMKFFHGKQDELKAAVQKGDIDIAYRGLAMKDIADLESAAGDKQNVKVVEGTSAEIQHLVFNTKDTVAGKPGVRKAIAYLIDRSALVRDVYKRTAEPLYSVVPSGITGHKTPFFDVYGDRPQPDKAKAALSSAGITGKVKLTLWATPVRYGPGTVPEFQEIAKQLNASGLFDADVKSVPFDEYEKGVRAGQYAVYAKGWVPDYPDPDNFTAPFFGQGSKELGNNYESKEISERILPATAAEGTRSATAPDFAKLQTTIAQDVPVLPLWQGKQYAVANSRVNGLQWTLDASTVFRFWEISKAAKG